MESLTVATNRTVFNLKRPMNRFCASREFARATSGTRMASHTVPVTAGKSLAVRCSCGAASLKAANRFCRRPAGDKDMSKLSAIGLMAETVPSGARCTRPSGARCKKFIRLSSAAAGEADALTSLCIMLNFTGRAAYEGCVVRFAENLSYRSGPRQKAAGGPHGPLQTCAKSITNCDLGLGFDKRGHSAGGGSWRMAACDADPFGRELPLRAEIVSPGSRPGVSRVIGRRTVVEAAGLMRSEVVEACRQPLPGPLQTGKRECRVVSHPELILIRLVRTDNRVAVEVLCDKSPIRRGREARAQTGKARPPRGAPGHRRRAGVGSIVIAQCAHLEPVVMPPVQARVKTRFAVDLMIKGDGWPS